MYKDKHIINSGAQISLLYKLKQCTLPLTNPRAPIFPHSPPQSNITSERWDIHIFIYFFISLVDHLCIVSRSILRISVYILSPSPVQLFSYFVFTCKNLVYIFEIHI